MFLHIISSFRDYSSANDSPLLCSASRRIPSAFGPMPCSFKSSASLTCVSCSRCVYPAASSACCAGLLVFGKSLLGLSVDMVYLHLSLTDSTATGSDHIDPARQR